ncbi:hypothetical protein CMUS01_11547 [Colletotrichum musicola]|uniref:Uncharacterized protein n=1 Tax=Colletotrichum musicola TaxID=2175873 RepID=A0A8H6JX27_9PEZI|nr:hypothetical protein CMUS01_11547 [Colletotrichum musicola]
MGVDLELIVVKYGVRDEVGWDMPSSQPENFVRTFGARDLPILRTMYSVFDSVAHALPGGTANLGMVDNTKSPRST